MEGDGLEEAGAAPLGDRNQFGALAHERAPYTRGDTPTEALSTAATATAKNAPQESASRGDCASAGT